MSEREAQRRIVDDYAGHKLYDESGEKIGKVEYTVLDAEGRPEYLAVKTGLFGTGTTLIPEKITRLGDRDREFEVQASERAVKDAPTFSDESELTPDFERGVAEHFGLKDENRDSESRDSRDSGTATDSTASTSERGEGRERSGDSAEARDERDRDRETSAESRESRPDDLRDDERRDGERDSRESGAATGAVASGRTDDERRDNARRDERRDIRDDARADDRRDDERRSSGIRDERGPSSEARPGERETMRVSVKRERAYAERVRGEDGAEEVRVRKEMVEEEEVVEVEDRL